MSTPLQQRAVHWPPLLDTKRIVKLTDAAQALFNLLYDMERDSRRDIRRRAALLAGEIDLFGPTPHYANHEGYVPDGGQR